MVMCLVRKEDFHLEFPKHLQSTKLNDSATAECSPETPTARLSGGTGFLVHADGLNHAAGLDPACAPVSSATRYGRVASMKGLRHPTVPDVQNW